MHLHYAVWLESTLRTHHNRSKIITADFEFLVNYSEPNEKHSQRALERHSTAAGSQRDVTQYFFGRQFRPLPSHHHPFHPSRRLSQPASSLPMFQLHLVLLVNFAFFTTRPWFGTSNLLHRKCGPAAAKSIPQSKRENEQPNQP